MSSDEEDSLPAATALTAPGRFGVRPSASAELAPSPQPPKVAEWSYSSDSSSSSDSSLAFVRRRPNAKASPSKARGGPAGTGSDAKTPVASHSRVPPAFPAAGVEGEEDDEVVTVQRTVQRAQLLAKDAVISQLASLKQSILATKRRKLAQGFNAADEEGDAAAAAAGAARMAPALRRPLPVARKIDIESDSDDARSDAGLQVAPQEKGFQIVFRPLGGEKIAAFCRPDETLQAVIERTCPQYADRRAKFDGAKLDKARPWKAFGFEESDLVELG